MQDLSKIQTPFGLLDKETQEALKQWEDGIEFYTVCGWLRAKKPSWNLTLTYRAITPPLIQDSINWDHVHPDYNWMARDSDGDVFLYKSKPVISRFYLSFAPSIGESMDPARVFTSYVDGNVSWEESLVKRPSHQE